LGRFFVVRAVLYMNNKQVLMGYEMIILEPGNHGKCKGVAKSSCVMRGKINTSCVKSNEEMN